MAEKKYFIATGKKRYQQRGWVNECHTWEEIVGMLSEPTVTAETMAEYKAMSHEQRTEVKDVGGFVGGYVRDGKRRKENIFNRDFLTYDYDEFGEAALERVRGALLGNAWALYSTHSHTAEKWRVRIIIPMTRPVLPDEFPAVARKVAQRLGFDGLDKGSVDISRLMFFPSVSKDGPFMFEEGKGDILNPGRILAEYHDWKDAGEWPLFPDEKSADLFSADIPNQTMSAFSRKGNGGKLEDPTAKEGIIGAWCRTYDIRGAIAEYLPHVYTAEPNGHYTHCGSTTRGNALIREEGKFLYSFHGTDPLQGMMLNSWDLVRLALFRDKDTKAKSDTRTSRLPSTEAMEELAMKDKRVKARFFMEKGNDFEGLETLESAEESEKAAIIDGIAAVVEGLTMKKGEYEVTANNVDWILHNDPALKDKLVYDVFSGDIVIKGRLPWKTHSQFWGDKDDKSLLTYFDKKYGMRKNTQIIERTFVDYLNNHGVHPVKEYLAGLPEWDGEKRLCRLFTDILGAEDTALNRRLAELIFTAAVRRIEQPGEKYDYCVVLHGPEGAYKSTLFSVMAGEWFSDSISSIEGKSGMESIGGIWIAEISELTGLKKSELATQKAFISSQRDRFRAAYAKRPETRPRQCVMVGTTNEDLFLKGVNDKNRRMPVVEIDPRLRKIEETPREWLTRHRDILWAEAKALEREKKPLYLEAELEEAAKEVMERHNMDLEDPMFTALKDFLEWWVPVNWDEISLEERESMVMGDPRKEPNMFEGEKKKRDRVTIPEIMEKCLGIPKSNQSYRGVARQMGQYMKRMAPEWYPIGPQRGAYGLQKTWKRDVTVTEGIFGLGNKNSDPLNDL